MENKFVDITESKEIDIKTLMQTLKEIKQLRETFPELTIKVKSNYNQVQFANEFGFTKNAALELENVTNGWIIKSHNFPLASAQNYLKTGSIYTLKNAAENFILMGNNMLGFFRAMDTLTSSCKILSPVEAQRETCTWRLIKYSQFASIKIEFPNPMDVAQMEVRFFGKQEIVDKLKETYDKSREKLVEEMDIDDDDDFDVYRDLCTKLDVLEFPAHENSLNEQDDECAICLCQENEFNQLPFICCDNWRCECLFHLTCLYKHLNIKSTKVLATMLGDCPFCKHKISSNFIGLLQKCNLLNEN